MIVVLDTTAVSDIMRREPAAVARLEAAEPREVVLCAPVAAEIRYGLERLEPSSRRRLLLEGEYQRLRRCVAWADWTEDAATIFGQLKVAVQQAGAPIDDMDLVVASIAVSLGATVATSNVRHFLRVPGLTIDEWAQR